MIHFWLKIITDNESKLNSNMYKVLFHMYRNNIYKSPWLKCIQEILISCGLINVWERQLEFPFNVKWVKSTVKQKLKDLFVNKWYCEMQKSNSCILYKEIKTVFCQEKYFSQLPQYLSICFCKFRRSNFQLPIVKGRYNNIPIHHRYCEICEENQIGDEYHILLECKNEQIVRLRKMYLPFYYQSFSNIYKFVSLFRSSFSK